MSDELRKTARDVARARFPVAELRRSRDARDADGFSRAAWRELARLGLAGITIPEAQGGAGLGFAELGIVAEELGRQLAATPLLSTVVLAGSAAHDADLLRGIAAGQRILAFAHDEGTRHARRPAATFVDGDRLTGEKVMVLDGHVADAFVVSALDRDAPGLYLVRQAVATRTFLVD